MGVYKPSIQVQPEDEDEFYPNGFDGNETLSRTTENAPSSSGKEDGWRKFASVENIQSQTTFVNEDAIYVNSTFKGMKMQITPKRKIFGANQWLFKMLRD